jgi:hypothetical protein
MHRYGLKISAILFYFIINLYIILKGKKLFVIFYLY